MFERSNSGQQNRALFFGVDYICYVEGGGGRSDYGPDVSFWSSVFGTFRPDLKVRFTARGGKPVLEGLANEILENDISNTIVALDGDYDSLTGDCIPDRRVLYTYGYSWENDVYALDNLIQAYCSICHCATPPGDAAAEMSTQLDRLAGELRRPVIADFFAFQTGSSLLPRDAPGRVIKPNRETGLPAVARDQVIKLARAAKSARIKPIPPGLIAPEDTLRFCVGKVIAFAARCLLKAVIHTHHGKVALPPDHLRDVAILTFTKLLTSTPGNPTAQHYHQQCAAL